MEENKLKFCLLSKTEEKIISLLCQELSSKEISNKLFISTRTVERHRENIMRKIGARNLAGIVNYGNEHGLNPLLTSIPVEVVVKLKRYVDGVLTDLGYEENSISQNFISPRL